MRFVPIVGLLVAASASAQSSIPEQAACAQDSDCEVSTFSSCCAMCPSEPYATNKVALEMETQRCARVHCPGPTRECPKTHAPSAFHAACVSGACVLKPANSECTVDDDCAITDQEGCCSRCPLDPPQALTKKLLHAHTMACAHQGKCASHDDDCANRTSTIDSYRAACEVGRCVAKSKSKKKR